MRNADRARQVAKTPRKQGAGGILGALAAWRGPLLRRSVSGCSALGLFQHGGREDLAALLALEQRGGGAFLGGLFVDMPAVVELGGATHLELLHAPEQVEQR